METYERVEEEHPLKQGLKLEDRLSVMETEKVEEEHPLKQGLKPKIKVIPKLLGKG